MLSLVLHALKAQAGLTDPTDPLLTVRVQIKDGEDPQIFLSPSDGDNGPFTTLIQRRLKENPVPKIPGSYIWRVRQYSDLVTVADDASHARFLFGLFRRDLALAFEAMEEMLRSLPSEARLQEALDDLVRRRFARMIKDGTFIDPRELRLSVLCEGCGHHNLNLRKESTQHELRELEKAIEERSVRLQEQGVTFSEATIAKKRLLLQRIAQITKAPPVKDNELFLASTVDHNHPFYDLNAFLLSEAGNALMHQRATIIAREFLSRIDSFSKQLLEALKPDSYQGVF